MGAVKAPTALLLDISVDQQSDCAQVEIWHGIHYHRAREPFLTLVTAEGRQ